MSGGLLELTMHVLRKIPFAALLLAAPVTVAAECAFLDYKCEALEEEDRQEQQKHREESISSQARQRENVSAARSNWEKQPALAANRNPLIGKWLLQQSNVAGQNDLLGAMLNPVALLCSGLFGDEIIDYRTDAVADGEGNVLDAVKYRGDGKRVAVLGTRGVQLLVFDFESPHRIKSTPHDCMLERVRPQVQVAAHAPAAAGTPTAVGAPAKGAAPVAAPPRSPPHGGIANLGVNFGVSIDAVRQSLAARRVSLTPGQYNGNLFGFTADGEFSDLDGRIKRVWYEFDGPEGPAARLSGVVITYARDAAAQSAVYNERAAAMKKQYPLAPQSPTEMKASTPGATVSLLDDGAAVYEIYRVR